MVTICNVTLGFDPSPYFKPGGLTKLDGVQWCSLILESCWISWNVLFSGFHLTFKGEACSYSEMAMEKSTNHEHIFNRNGEFTTIKVPDEQWTWNIAFHNHDSWWLEQLLNINLWWLVLFRLVVSFYVQFLKPLAVKYLDHPEWTPTRFSTRFLWHCHINAISMLVYWSPFFLGFPIWFSMVSSWKSPMKSPLIHHEEWEWCPPWCPGCLLFQEALVWVANDLAIGTGEAQEKHRRTTTGPGPPKIGWWFLDLIDL